MKKKSLLSEVRQLQKIAGLLKEDLDEHVEEGPGSIKDAFIQNPSEILGNIIDQMQEDEEGLDQGLKPSQLIKYDLVAQKAAELGLNLDITKLKRLAKANDSGFLYSGEEMVDQATNN